MRSLESACSILSASSASYTLRSNETSLVKRKFFATCWVMVEAPMGRRFEPMCVRFVSPARMIDSTSMPGCD